MAGPFGEDLTGNAALQRVADISRRLAEAESVDETLQRVVDLAEAYIENCHGATMMLIGDGGTVSTPASTSQEVRLADLAQYETGEGPCLQAMREHELIVIEDVDSEQRWPTWRERVTELGWRSMVGLRLFIAENTMGALDLYSRQPEGVRRPLAGAGAGVRLPCCCGHEGLHQRRRAAPGVGVP